MRQRWTVLLTLCLVVTGLVIGAPPASAHNASTLWKYAWEQVCEGVDPAHETIIMAVQANLWAQNYYAGQPGGNTLAQVDGIFGPATKGAIRAYQRAHPGLAVDGCAGPKTLDSMQKQHLKVSSTSGNTTYYNYISSSKVKYYKVNSGLNGHWFFKPAPWTTCYLEVEPYTQAQC